MKNIHPYRFGPRALLHFLLSLIGLAYVLREARVLWRETLLSVRRLRNRS